MTLINYLGGSAGDGGITAHINTTFKVSGDVSCSGIEPTAWWFVPEADLPTCYNFWLTASDRIIWGGSDAWPGGLPGQQIDYVMLRFTPENQGKEVKCNFLCIYNALF